MKQKKNYLSWIALIAVVAIFLSAISLYRSNGVGSSGKQTDSLQKIIQTKKMNVAVAEWPPFSVKDAATGKYSGVDIDAIELMAKELGAEVIYHDTTFGNMPAAIQSGTCEVGTSLFITPSRAAAVDFARPILYGGDRALIRKGDTRFKTLADLDQPGIKIATATGESGDIFAKANFKKATIVPIDVESSDQSRFMLEVTSGRADIAVAGYNIISDFAKVHPETEVVFQDNPFNLSPDAYPVRHGDTSLQSFLSNSILTMQVNGTWEQIEKKYNVTATHQILDIR